jgi:hypothetical protein
MKKKWLKRYGEDLLTEFGFNEEGDGLFCEEIALKLGVLNHTNDNPNGRLIKQIAEFLKLKPSGVKTTEVYNQTKNTDTVGYHFNQKPKYSKEDVEKIKFFIQELNDDGQYIFRGIKFRLKSR